MKIIGLSPPAGRLLHDGIAFDAAGDGTVERDENNVPAAWRVLSEGSNPLIKNGVPGEIILSADDMDSIVKYYTDKGERIPVDSRHYLYRLGNLKKLDEAEIAKLMPTKVAAMGYGGIERRGGELWINDVQWNPTAYELMKEGIFKYFSPALRGLAKPPLRLTSVALENEPSINHLDALAASADDNLSDSDEPDATPTRRSSMTRLEKAIAGLIGRDSIALEAEGPAADAATAIESKTKLLAALREALKLSDDVSDSELAGALKGAIEKAGGYDAMKTELDNVKAEQETAKRDDLVQKGLDEGKLTEDTAEKWAKKQDSEALAAYLEHAPVVVPLDKVNRKKLPETPNKDEVALSADDEKAIGFFGFDKEKYLDAKKGK